MRPLPTFPTSSTTAQVWEPESRECRALVLTTAPVALSTKQFPSEQVEIHANVRTPIVPSLLASHVNATDVAAAYAELSPDSGVLVTDTSMVGIDAA